MVGETVAFDPQCERHEAAISAWMGNDHSQISRSEIKSYRLRIGSKELAFRIAYVDCSRVKSYRALVFQMSFPWEKVNRVKD
jgi:hypothetical protein